MAMDTVPMILDERMPAWDVTISVHQVVSADPRTTWQAARDLDFMSVHSPLMDLSMWARGLPARLRGQPLPRPASVRLAGGEGMPGWLSLGETDGYEIAFGAVGVFWTSSIRWHEVTREEFARFTEPGYGKIGCNFTVRPYGAQRTLLTYECRVVTTDPESRRKFARYWRLIRPFVGHIMRASLVTIAADAQRQARAAREPAPTG
jgi:hypothetical protein